jgi:hypothetical protein
VALPPGVPAWWAFCDGLAAVALSTEDSEDGCVSGCHMVDDEVTGLVGSALPAWAPPPVGGYPLGPDLPADPGPVAGEVGACGPACYLPGGPAPWAA